MFCEEAAARQSEVSHAVAQRRMAAHAEVALAAVSKRHHNHPFSSVFPYAAGVVTDDSPLLDFPVTTVKMQVRAADASRLEFCEDLSAFHFGFWYIFNLDVFRSMVNSGFQK